MTHVKRMNRMIHTELLMSDQYWIKTQMAEISAYRKWRVNTSAGTFSFGQSVTHMAVVHLLRDISEEKYHNLPVCSTNFHRPTHCRVSTHISLSPIEPDPSPPSQHMTIFNINHHLYQSKTKPKTTKKQRQRKKEERKKKKEKNTNSQYSTQPQTPPPDRSKTRHVSQNCP